MRKKTIGILVTIMLVITFIGCGKDEVDDGIVDIFDYVTVDYSGKNGEGVSNVVIDYDGLELEMVGGQEKLDELDSVEDLETLNKYINVCASLSFSTDQHDNLSNGDYVTVSVTYDEDAAADAGVVFGEETSHKYEVSGLE